MSLHQAEKKQVIKPGFLQEGKKASVAALQLPFHRTVRLRARCQPREVALSSRVWLPFLLATGRPA